MLLLIWALNCSGYLGVVELQRGQGGRLAAILQVILIGCPCIPSLFMYHAHALSKWAGPHQVQVFYISGHLVDLNCHSATIANRYLHSLMCRMFYVIIYVRFGAAVYVTFNHIWKVARSIYPFIASPILVGNYFSVPCNSVAPVISARIL